MTNLPQGKEMIDLEQLIDSLRHRPVATTASQMRLAASTLEIQANTIGDLRQQIALRESADSHAHCDVEIAKLRALVKKALEAWEGSGPAIILDELREAL